MKVLPILAAAILTAATPQLAFAQEATSDPANMTSFELAQEIVDRGLPEGERVQMFAGASDAVIAQIRQSMPDIEQDPERSQLMDELVEDIIALQAELLPKHVDAIMLGMTEAYAETYSKETLVAFHAFIMSPEGDGFLLKMNEIVGHPSFAAANQAYMNEYMSRAPELLRDFAKKAAAIEAERSAE